MYEPGGWWSTSGRFVRTVVNAVLVVAVMLALISVAQARGRVLLVPAGCEYVVNDAGQPEPAEFCEL